MGLPEPYQPESVVGRDSHGFRPLHRLLEEGNGLSVAAGERVGQSQRRRHRRKEQGDIGEPADDEAALEGGGRLHILPSQQIDHGRPHAGHDQAEGMILGLGERRRFLRIRVGLVEPAELGEAEGEPRAGHNRGETGEPEGLAPEIALEQIHVAPEGFRRARIISDRVVYLPEIVVRAHGVREAALYQREPRRDLKSPAHQLTVLRLLGKLLGHPARRLRRQRLPGVVIYAREQRREPAGID